MNDLNILVADIQNIYFNALTKERVYTLCGLEFGSNVERPTLIVKFIYGLKSSGARFRNYLAQILLDLGFKSHIVDLDMWIRHNTKLDGFKYWEY